MQYFKYETTFNFQGKKTENSGAGAGDGGLLGIDEEQFDISPRQWRAIRRDFSSKTATFNKKFKDKGIFISDMDEDKLELSIISAKFISTEDARAFSSKFISHVGLGEEDFLDCQEISLTDLVSQLSNADRNDFIYDMRDFSEKFRFSPLICSRRGDVEDFFEEIITVDSKKVIYKNAAKLITAEDLTPELDRIYMGKKAKLVFGQPVQYITYSDSGITEHATCDTLINALYDAGRIVSKRYSIFNFDNRMGCNILERWEVADCLYRNNVGGVIVARCGSSIDEDSNYADLLEGFLPKLCALINKWHNKVLTIISLPKAADKERALVFENSRDIAYVEIKETLLRDEGAVNWLKKMAKSDHLRTNKALTSKLEEGKAYTVKELEAIYDIWFNNRIKYDVFPQYSDFSSTDRELTKKKPTGDAYNELMSMTGLGNAKKVIKNALDFFKAQRLYESRGIATIKPNMHMIFTGNPGTAKTTVARLVARIFRDNGLVSEGKFVEVGRGDLVGKFVGWTAPTIKKKFKEASGGVLFIDEAYSLVDDSGSFGDEAINTIVQEMENHRDDVIVIFAGYSEEMEEFINKNPGLRSRIAFHVPFDDYDSDELCEISRYIADKQGFTLDKGAIEKLRGIYDEVSLQKDFGNGRYARNMVEKARMAQASRIMDSEFESLSDKDFRTILAEDIEEPLTKKAKICKIGFTA